MPARTCGMLGLPTLIARHMDYLVISLVALAISMLTLFSGFGLGTVLMPTFALFFPVQAAIAATAVVHLANNIFKVMLVGRKARWDVVLRFALPGALAAIIGATLLNAFAASAPLLTYDLGNQSREVTPIKLVIGLLIILFAILELSPRFNQLAFDRQYLPLGGLLSGFFGGLSGNQGALRSAFLIKAGLDKDEFVGTSTVSSVIVDIARLLTYGLAFYSVSFAQVREVSGYVIAATSAAFIGAFTGSRLLSKIKLRTIQVLISAMLFIVGAGMLTGLL